MKAIIDISPKGSAVPSARSQLRSSRAGKAIHYHLHYETARLLFSDLTPARVELLHTLQRTGPTSVYALAKAAGRHYTNVHGDIAALENIELVTRTKEDLVWVPYESIQINLAFAESAA
jgi:predicted transcriptional regulator